MMSSLYAQILQERKPTDCDHQSLLLYPRLIEQLEEKVILLAFGPFNYNENLTGTFSLKYNL